MKWLAVILFDLLNSAVIILFLSLSLSQKSAFLSAIKSNGHRSLSMKWNIFNCISAYFSLSIFISISFLLLLQTLFFLPRFGYQCLLTRLCHGFQSYKLYYVVNIVGFSELAAKCCCWGRHHVCCCWCEWSLLLYSKYSLLLFRV